MRLRTWAVAAAVVSASLVSSARANWVDGKVYCDSNFSRTLDAGDTPLDGVKVTATSQTAIPGQIYVDPATGDTYPQAPAVPGFWKIYLPARVEDWKVELPGPGLPSGASIILPVGGSYLAHIDPSTLVTDHVDNLDFLVDCNPPPLCTDASCDDGNPCTDDHCDPHVGCSHTNNTVPCDDGNPCTENDVCSGGQCQPGTPKVCNDGNPCTDDFCDPQIGCTSTNNTLPCDDGNACTTTDVCGDGACQPGPPKNCDDGNTCNGIELCLPDVGCVPGPPPYLTKTSGRFGNLASINADIGTNDVGGTFRLGRNAHMPDATDATADMVSLGNGTSVYDVFASKIGRGAGAVVRHSVKSATLPITEPYCVIPSLTCGGPDVNVPAEADGGTIAPGSYGRLVMGSASTLVLSGGEYHFCSVKTARAAHILVQGASASQIDVAGNLLFADQTKFEVASGTPIPTVRVSGSAIRFGSNADVQLDMLAPNAHLSIGRTGHVTGSFCVATASTDKSITLDCPPPVD